MDELKRYSPYGANMRSACLGRPWEGSTEAIQPSHRPHHVEDSAITPKLYIYLDATPSASDFPYIFKVICFNAWTLNPVSSSVSN